MKYIILLFIPLMFLKEIYSLFLFKKNNFLCNRCGDCCSFLVKIDKADISKIKNNVNIMEDFVDRKIFFSFLKRNKGKCVFYREGSLNSSESTCSIYDYRPKTCAKYPYLVYGNFNGFDKRCKGLIKKDK